ncbi:hypothetical protein ABGB12_25705 [Actinocorallia sp. B10E7]|uniref:hypothetical protein n=1 Tax=Actinocorallia sp. B10E7 TaxID=3153558 RepID=UPI00325E0E02
MTASSRHVTQGVDLFGRLGLALLAAFVIVHMVSCLPGLHESTVGESGGHDVSVPAHLENSDAASSCEFDLAEFRGVPMMYEEEHHHEEHHHASCADVGALGWLEGGTASVLGMMIAMMAAAVLLLRSWAGRETADGGRGSPPADDLPVGYWIRHHLRGAMLPACLCVSRT